MTSALNRILGGKMVNKSETPITKFKAAVYQKTPAPWLPSKPKFLTIIIIMQIILICVSEEWRDSRVAWLILGILIPVSGWLLMRWRIYSSVFITPSGRSKKTITDQRWKEFYFSGWGEERMKAHYLKSEIESEDTILYLHGYNSSLGNGESRCQHINSLGFNVIGLDQRGFGKQKGRHEWTILKVVADIEMLLEEAPNVLGFTPKKFWIYGHSLGGFLTIRLSSHPSGWWEKSMQGIILESPATSFPLIIEKKLPGRAVMASPWVRHILRREYQRIHPDLNVGYANAQIPYWGSPKVPILVVQAEDDETLGVDHFNLLKEHFSENSDIHILSEMPHTSKVDVKERREILEKWLER